MSTIHSIGYDDLFAFGPFYSLSYYKNIVWTHWFNRRVLPSSGFQTSITLIQFYTGQILLGTDSYILRAVIFDRGVNSTCPFYRVIYGVFANTTSFELYFFFNCRIIDMVIVKIEIYERNVFR